MFDTVKLDLAGQTVELVPSLNAVELINKRFGNFAAALDQVGSMNFDAIVDVVDAGIESSKKLRGYDKKELKLAIYEHGFMNSLADVLEFIVICSNGGKRVEDGDTNDTDDSKKKI